MGDDDLHSIAFSSHSSDNHGVLSYAEILSSQIYMEMADGGYTPPYSHGDYSSYAANNNSSSSNCVEEQEECDNDSSSGYLEDVLLDFSSKRRRSRFLFADDHQQQQQYYSTDHHFRYNILDKNCSTSDFIPKSGCHLDTLDQIINPNGVSDMKTPEEAISETYNSSSSSYKESTSTQWTPDVDDDDDNKGTLYRTDPMPSLGVNEKIKKKRVTTPKVVYPFAVVKPGGFEGDATLNDINERILMPPTRPVRHPVGDFACRPMVVSPQGPSLSGKAVVAFTRLHTQGRGTITIIRTRG